QFVITYPHLCSLFFFVTHRHTPTSTLFPYTTLFRSRHVYPLGHRPRGCPICPRGHRRHLLCPGCCRQAADLRPLLAVLHLHVGLDRKSTRLNSSHVKISYAVFCLKKKRKKPQITSNS